MIQDITIIIYCKRVTIDSKLKIHNISVVTRSGDRKTNSWYNILYILIGNKISRLYFHLPGLAGLVFQFHLLVRLCQQLQEAQQFEPSKDIKDKF